MSNTRSTFLCLAAALVLVLPGCADAAPAGSTRARAWDLGGKLSLAAIAAYEGAPKASVDKVFQAAVAIGASLNVTVPALPDLPLNKDQAKAQVVDYILKTAGAPIADSLGKSYGADVAALFEVSVKSNLLLMLYAPGEEIGNGVSAVLRKRAPDAKIPDGLWQPVISKLDVHAPYDDVKDAVVKMQGDVRAYLKTEQ